MKKNQEEQYDPFEEAGPSSDDAVENDEQPSSHHKKRRRANRERKLGLGVLGVLVVVLLGAVGYRVFSAWRAMPASVGGGGPASGEAAQKVSPTAPQPAVSIPTASLPTAATLPSAPRTPPPTFKIPDKTENVPAQKPTAAAPTLSAPALAAPTLTAPEATPPAISSSSAVAAPSAATAPLAGFAAAAAKPTLESPPAPQTPNERVSTYQPAPALLSAPANTPAPSLNNDAPRPLRYSQRYEPQGSAPSETHTPGEAATVTGEWRYGQNGTRSGASSATVRMTATSSEAYASAGALPRRSADAGVRTDGTYKVQPNDSYWTISERLYGSGAYFKALAEVNRQNTPQVDRLQVGATLVAPAVEELHKKHPDLCPKPEHRRQPASRMTSVGLQGNLPGRRVYIVEAGDNLFEIARRELGRADRWAEIYDLNRDKLGDDTNYLAPGTRLTMPDGRETRSSGNRVAERTDDVQRR